MEVAQRRAYLRVYRVPFFPDWTLSAEAVRAQKQGRRCLPLRISIVYDHPNPSKLEMERGALKLSWTRLHGCMIPIASDMIFEQWIDQDPTEFFVL